MEPKKNVLPESSPDQVIEVDNDAVTPVAAPEIQPEVSEEVPEVQTVPLAALEQERAWRKDWEQKYKDLQTASQVPFEPDASGADAVVLSEQVQTLTEKLTTLEKREALRELTSAYPQLADKQAEFDEFLQDPENSMISIQKAAKLFLAENGMLVPERKGLEQPSGGNRAPQPSGMSVEDVRLLRQTQPRKYERMIRDGSINADDIR